MNQIIHFSPAGKSFPYSSSFSINTFDTGLVLLCSPLAVEKDCKSRRNFDNEALVHPQEEGREEASERFINQASGGRSRAVVN